MSGESEFLVKFLPSAALTLVLALLALYFVKRASARNMDTPAVWGATVSTTAIFGLSFLQTLSQFTGVIPEIWFQSALRTIAVLGIVQFWWFYRRVLVTDPKNKRLKNKAKGA